jgi:hypothetical protein
MSHQEDIEAAKQAGIEQFDFTLGMEFDITPGDIYDLAQGLEQADAFDANGASDETLAEYSAALKALSDAAEDARKDVFENELDDRIATAKDVLSGP